MKELTIAEIKKIEIQILDHFDSFCRENKLSYFLSNGTLLGAIKYGGFIPWDDDIDIMMPRSDYDRFVEMYNSDRFKLVCPKNAPAYCYPFSKIYDEATVLVEDNLDNGVEIGVYMDVFPIDQWPDRISNAKKYAKYQRKWVKLLGLAKTMYYIPHESRSRSESLVRSVAHRILRFIGPGYFCKRLEINAKRYLFTESPYVGCVIWPAYIEKEVLPSEVFKHKVYVEFEGGYYPAPADYDTYLKNLYGDYRLDPPAEKKKSHHNFMAFYK